MKVEKLKKGEYRRSRQAQAPRIIKLSLIQTLVEIVNHKLTSNKFKRQSSHFWVKKYSWQVRSKEHTMIWITYYKMTTLENLSDCS
jgi:hypothetical protein